ncbi:MAG: hypothetical protein ACI87W_003568 [Halieaceae bacterium]
MKELFAGALLVGSGLALGGTQSTVIEMPVVATEPVVEVFRERIPHETCRQERVRVVERGRESSATATILGAVAGGAIGAVLGDNSRNKDLIAGAGAVLGASVGHDAGNRQQNDAVYYVTEDVCSVEYELRDGERVNGYRVSYRFGDTIYETRSSTEPGETIAVRVNLEPLP